MSPDSQKEDQPKEDQTKNRRTQGCLQPRKLPNQKRSREKVDKILAATVCLLETMGGEKITTNHIAREAGIPVASLYQYFPNKHAVIYAVFQQWLDWIIARFDAIEAQYYLTSPWDEFFNQLMVGILENTGFSYGAENQLSRFMGTTPGLIELDRQHGDDVARRLAGYLKGYGSHWPQQDLIGVGHLFYHLCSLLYNRFGDETIIGRKQLLGWGRTMVNALLAESLSVNS